ncbi:tol-pal system protein YbgF [Luteimonas aestuarii]|uniref:Cell division coordinator CpoB n=1 Tax=Luteimonas aestuarii TaxID=453837 RepID=A0A4R5TPR8_9GAMM|nr:tol-pal system protein YbgF [Luteimonas aestuarii]TDK20494.1 tol-pal system protein YbgF [Luteimonas aestuarii]
MLKILAPIACAAALVAAAPAFAQRASLADRVAVLEQRAADNQGNIDLLNQLTALRTEVQALRAQVEELQQQNEQLRTTSQHQYLDLDGRLERLEGGAMPPAAAGGQPALPPPASATSPAARDPGPTIHGDPGSLSQMQVADERAAYEAAFDALRSGQYEESARRFQQFLTQFPSGSYAPNARYWLGESYYVTQDYARALEQFQTLVRQHPTHDKTPGSVLKIGLSQYGLNDLDAAEATLARVGQQYPGTDAARTAEDRLHAIQISRLR